MFSNIKSTIDKIALPSSEFILNENKFTRKSKFSFKDYVTFFCFNKGTSNQVDLEDFIGDDFTRNLQPISRQALSKQRIYINPEIFKKISRGYLFEINYDRDNGFFEDYKGYRLFSGDGSDFEIPDFKEVREEFNIKDTPFYRKPAMGKFSSIMDLLNGYILDGIIGNYKEGELPLMHQNLDNIMELINPEKSIFIFDRGYNAIELYARIISMKGKFIVRLKNKSYKAERQKINKNDSPLKIKLTKSRLNKFHNKELKEEYSKENYLNLRIIIIELDNGTTEFLLTNILEKDFTIRDFKKLYNLRWNIETNYNTIKNRLNIENYSGKKRITIEQDIYSKFLRYNIFQHYKNYFNLLINKVKRKKGVKNKYQVDQAHLIRKLKKFLPIMILNPISSIIRDQTR